MKTKKCPKCGIEKLVSEFNKRSLAKDGLCPWCRVCIKENQKEYSKRPEVKARRKEYSKGWRQENKEQLKEKKKEYYQDNKKKIEEKRKEYLQDNKEKIREQQKEYNQKNKEKFKEYKKRYCQKNREKHKEYCKEYHQRPEIKEKRNNAEKLKRLTDHQFKLNNNISGAMRRSLKGNKSGRHWETLVGYTLQELKLYLEKQFDLFMTWENQGSYWHIDHVVPVSWFKFTKSEDEGFKKCWALENLQPMEGIENIKKGNRVSYKRKDKNMKENNSRIVIPSKDYSLMTEQEDVDGTKELKSGFKVVRGEKTQTVIIFDNNSKTSSFVYNNINYILIRNDDILARIEDIVQEGYNSIVEPPKESHI